MAASGWGLCRRSHVRCHSLEPSSAPSGQGYLEGLHLVLLFLLWMTSLRQQQVGATEVV